MAEKRTRRRFTAEGTGGQATAGGRSRAVGDGDRTGAEHRAAEHVAQRTPRGRIGRDPGYAQSQGGRSAAVQAREHAA